MSGFSDSDNNASIRGYIMRCLVKGYHFSCLAKDVSNRLLANGLVDTPDISNHLYYLEQCQLIEFTDKSVDAFQALKRDAVIRLTAEGIRFIENGGDTGMRIDL